MKSAHWLPLERWRAGEGSGQGSLGFPASAGFERRTAPGRAPAAPPRARAGVPRPRCVLPRAVRRCHPPSSCSRSRPRSCSPVRAAAAAACWRSASCSSSACRLPSSSGCCCRLLPPPPLCGTPRRGAAPAPHPGCRLGRRLLLRPGAPSSCAAAWRLVAFTLLHQQQRQPGRRASCTARRLLKRKAHVFGPPPHACLPY